MWTTYLCGALSVSKYMYTSTQSYKSIKTYSVEHQQNFELGKKNKIKKKWQWSAWKNQNEKKKSNDVL